jgi:hypothetical protein
VPDYTYIYDPIETGPDALQQDAFDFIQSQWPNWVPSESQLATWMIAVLARMVAEARAVAADVPLSIFTYYGQNIIGVPVITDTPARVDAQITLVSNPAGRLIEAGTLFGIADADGNVKSFEVTTDRSIAAAVLTTSPSPVTLQAIEYGSANNNLGGDGVLAENSEGIDWIDTITLTGPTVGGNDGESPEAYADRLSARLTLMSPRLILARDFALMARDIAAQNGVVVRTMALDNYNPADGTTNNEKMVAVAVVDSATGLAIPSGVKSDIDAGLQDQREINFVVNVIDPSYTTVDVTSTVVPIPGVDTEVARVNAETAVREYLQPYNFGKTQDTEAIDWALQTVLRHQDLSTVINNAPGVSHWSALTFGLNGGVQNTSDKTLTGAAPLTLPGVMLFTV